MLQKLSALIADALQRAAAADRRARDATDPQVRLQNQHFALGWRTLARSFELSEKFDLFLLNSAKSRHKFEPASDPADPWFLFRCPITGSRVQGFLIEEVPSDDPNSFDTVRCLDCGQIHLVNFTTGKTVGRTGE